MVKKRTAFVCITVGLAGIAAAVLAQPQQGSRPPGPPPGFPNLTKALKEIPGCLGIETARVTSGKNVIFAWFENKKAVEAWYNSPVHRDVMKKYFPDSGMGRPMADIPDDTGPILTIASITYSKNPEVTGTSLPISQIAIELYTPLAGGLAYGGRFAPETMKVPGMRGDSQNKSPRPKE